MVQPMTLMVGQSRRAVQEAALGVEAVTDGADMSPAARALRTFSARDHPRGHDRVPFLYRRDPRPHVLNDAGCLMTYDQGDGKAEPARDGAPIAMAETGIHGFHQHLFFLRRCQLDLLDTDGCVVLPAHCGFHLHEVTLLFLISLIASSHPFYHPLRLDSILYSRFTLFSSL